MARRLAGILLLMFVLASAARADAPWLIVSDLHIRVGDDSRVPSSAGSDSNWALFATMLDAMRHAVPHPGAIAIGGDLLAHHFPSDERAAESTIARIAHALGAAFPASQFFVALGNDDDPCGDYRMSTGGPYLSALAHIWAPLVNRGNAAPDFLSRFSRGGYYSARVRGTKLRLIALNSVYWSAFFHSPCQGAVTDPGAAQFAWLERTLSQRRMRTILLMHIPPGVDVMSTLMARGFITVPYLHADATAHLLRDLRTSRALVRLIIAGHMHSGGYRIFQGTPILIAPSVSPVYGNAPSFLVAQFNDGRVTDMTLYRYSYATHGWNERLDFDKLFGVTEFDAPNLRALARRLQAQPVLRSRWERFYNISSGDLWRSHWCAQEHLSDAYAACAGDQTRVALFPWLAGLAVLAALAFLGWCGMLGTQWIKRRKSA